MRCLSKLGGAVAIFTRGFAVLVEAVGQRPLRWRGFDHGTRDEERRAAVDTAKVDLVLQYALAVASQADDSFHRRLGKIHLLKYVYLADLANAERRGVSLTGAHWQFYHYGPWDLSVYNRIDPVLASLNADEFTWPSSKYETDTVRWSIDADDAKDVAADVERKLPVIVTVAVRRAVLKFGNDTSSLLHHVYTTTPMLRAAPGQDLDFGIAPDATDSSMADERNETAKPTDKELKRRKESMLKLKAKFQAAVSSASAQSARKPSALKPIYDDVYVDGARQIEELAGASPGGLEASASISDGVWTSEVRRRGGLP
jgi:hypothetical protein